MNFIYSFGSKSPDGDTPNGPLIQASDGNLYGTTRGGGRACRDGTFPCGTVFRVTPAGEEKVLYIFGANETDGYGPEAPLVQGRDGALYGTTASGGTYGAGTVFKITLDGTYTRLHSFGASPADGITPVAPLIQGSDGNFYGTTASGGANHCDNIPQSGGNCGTIFKMTPAGVTTILYSFGTSRADGVEPIAPLVEGADGNFYGTTLDGGANSCSQMGATNNCGTVFKMTPAGAVTILHSFGSSPTDGIAPQGPLIRGRDGAFYGTTVSGGGGRCGGFFGCGTVYRITSDGQLSVLYAFSLTTRSDGDGPGPFLIQGRDGNFYGTTNSGGEFAADLDGTVFRLTPAGVKTILYSFGPLNQAASKPEGGLVQASDGSFYGVTAYSVSVSGQGTVFKLSVR